MTSSLSYAEPAETNPRNKQVSAFTELMRSVQASGLMRRRYGYYWSKFVLLTVLLAASVAALFVFGSTWWQLVNAAVLALLLTQVAFLGHDAAHRQIFRSGGWNDWASLIIANLYGGLSYGWWQNKHSRHHAKPNQIETDPDMLNGVLIWETESITETKRGFRAWIAAHQGYLFFPLLLLEGLNLHVAGLRLIFGRAKVKRRTVEIILITVRLVGYVALVFWLLTPGLAAAFLGVQLGLFGFFMGASFAPNHKGMPTVPKNSRIDFLSRQVLMSRNITGGRWIDTAMGGLNFQIEHHLFPSMARPHLRKVRPMVKAFCEERGVRYTETSLLGSYKIVVEYLNRVGLAARDPFQCPLTQEFRSAR